MPLKWANAPCIAALALCGCAAPGITADAPKIVRAHPLPSYQIHEECFTLNPGDRVEYGFASTEPVAFNLHYHAGSADVMPGAAQPQNASAAMQGGPAHLNGIPPPVARASPRREAPSARDRATGVRPGHSVWSTLRARSRHAARA